MVAINVEGNLLSAVWVGDSEFIVIRGGRIMESNFDGLHGIGNRLFNAVGSTLPAGGIPGKTLVLQQGDIVILGSDGIFGPLTGGSRNINSYISFIEAQAKGGRNPEAIKQEILRAVGATGRAGDDASLIVYVHG